jgi:hypothetical protein
MSFDLADVFERPLHLVGLHGYSARIAVVALAFASIAFVVVAVDSRRRRRRPTSVPGGATSS